MPQWPWRNERPDVDLYGRSPLWHCAAKGDLQGLEAQLELGADATAADKDGFSSLHAAAQNGHDGIVARLIVAGADVNVHDKHGNGPLWTASNRASLRTTTEAAFKIVALLLSAKADPHHCNKAGRSPAFWAGHSTQLRQIYGAAGIEVQPDRS